MKTKILLCGISPLEVAGMRTEIYDREISESDSLPSEHPTEVVIVGASFGISNIINWLKFSSGQARVIIWGNFSPSDEVSLLLAGARAVLKTTALIPTIRRCIGQVADRKLWTANAVPVITDDCMQSLTSREVEVLHLVQRGLRNKDIADKLFIRPGTVKVRRQKPLRQNRCFRSQRAGSRGARGDGGRAQQVVAIVSRG